VEYAIGPFSTAAVEPVLATAKPNAASRRIFTLAR
jgi:hypothetical protein